MTEGSTVLVVGGGVYTGGGVAGGCGEVAGGGVVATEGAAAGVEGGAEGGVTGRADELSAEAAGLWEESPAGLAQARKTRETVMAIANSEQVKIRVNFLPSFFTILTDVPCELSCI
ncbi:MAG: hypothetical protein PHG36_03445 [Dehalococcoidia bacterium]|nr:hypothetical protein [Dehalococcoidia bacterium]